MAGCLSSISRDFVEEPASSSDMDFTLRLCRAGGKILLVSEIVSDYYAEPDCDAETVALLSLACTTHLWNPSVSSWLWSALEASTCGFARETLEGSLWLVGEAISESRHERK